MLIILKVVYLSKHFNILRKLKYHLSRTNLDKLYLVYIRPLFEYACELWDNCGIGNSQKLKQLQLPELLQAYLFLPKLIFYMERQVGNYDLRDGRE